jgi:hypothetical protein
MSRKNTHFSLFLKDSTPKFFSLFPEKNREVEDSSPIFANLTSADMEEPWPSVAAGYAQAATPCKELREKAT